MKTFSQLKKLLLIINPVSGRRTSLRFLPDIIRIFSEGDYAVTVFPTGKSGDATQFAQLYGSEFDLIVCIGGDGTLNEVITGIIRGECSTPLGVQYPRLAYDVFVSDGAASLPHGHYHGGQKEQRPRHGTQCKAGNYQYYQHRCRNNSCFQVTDLLS